MRTGISVHPPRLDGYVVASDGGKLTPGFCDASRRDEVTNYNTTVRHKANAYGSSKQLGHKGIIPSGLFSSASNTASGWTVVEQIESNFSQQSEIVPSMLFPDSGRIFRKCDIQHPMETVFYRPVLAYGGYLPLIFTGQAGKEIPLFCCHPSIRFDHPNRFHRQNAADSRPFSEHIELSWYWVHKHPAPGETTVMPRQRHPARASKQMARQRHAPRNQVSTACKVHFWLPFNVST